MPDAGLELPIFELPVVILPGELLPLHIFEDRYKRMIGHCLDAAEPFGIVFGDDDGARNVGCEARVAEVLEPFDVGAEPVDEDDDAGTVAREAFAALVERVSGERPEGSDLAAEDAYAIAARVELPPETKQRLLELRSER